MEELVKGKLKELLGDGDREFWIAFRKALLEMNDVIEKKLWPGQPTTAEIRRDHRQRQKRGGV